MLLIRLLTHTTTSHTTTAHVRLKLFEIVHAHTAERDQTVALFVHVKEKIEENLVDDSVADFLSLHQIRHDFQYFEGLDRARRGPRRILQSGRGCGVFGGGILRYRRTTGRNSGRGVLAQQVEDGSGVFLVEEHFYGGDEETLRMLIEVVLRVFGESGSGLVVAVFGRALAFTCVPGFNRRKNRKKRLKNVSK